MDNNRVASMVSSSSTLLLAVSVSHQHSLTSIKRTVLTRIQKLKVVVDSEASSAEMSTSTMPRRRHTRRLDHLVTRTSLAAF
jgi:hypothetical protein